MKKISDGDEEEDEDTPASRPYMETLQITVLRTKASRDLTDSELERTDLLFGLKA